VKRFYIKTSRYLLALTLFGAVVSCNIDDVKPYNQLTPENVIRDAESAQGVLNGIYTLGREFDLGFFPLHLAAYGTEGLITSNIGGATGFNKNEVSKDNDFLGKLYTAHYKVINQSNFLIEQLEAGKAVGISNERKAEMIAEAKYQRAFHYFNLLRYFGEYYDLNSSFGIVTRTEFATTIQTEARNSVKEVYKLIIDDLVYGSTYGPEYVEHFYSGKLASKALLAKVYLYTKNYDEAAILAQEVVENTEGYYLEEKYSNIFKNAMHSPEVIFAPFAGTGSEGGSKMEQISRTTYSDFLFNLADAQVEGNSSLSGNGENIDSRFAFAYSAATKGVNQQGKYPFTGITSAQKNTMYQMRLAEVYLIYAEALVRSGADQELALEQVNILRARAGIEPKEYTDKATLLTDIRHEKALELFFENGEPLFDLVRYAILDNFDIKSEKPSLNQKYKYILPIPLTVLSGNNKMVQNPGY